MSCGTNPLLAHKKGLLAEIFFGLNINIKNEKMHFSQIFGLSKWLTGRENDYQTGITGHEFGSQIHLPDKNLALKITYRTRIWPSNILFKHDFSYW